MTSLVGRLARTLSQGSGSTAEAERQRRGSFCSEGSPRLWPALSSPTGQSKLSTSPSFNDFSLSVQEDAVEELGSLFDSTDGGSTSLMSDDTIFSIDKAKYDNQGQQGTQACGPFASAFAAKTAGPEITASVPAPTSIATQSVPAKTKRVKIMGMDAYDYCDLLRSSSL